MRTKHLKEVLRIDEELASRSMGSGMGAVNMPGIEQKTHPALDVRHYAALRAPSSEGLPLPLQCGSVAN